MPTSPDITIVVPLHNDEAWVRDAIRSALDQTWTSLEVICVDDASTDGTCAAVEQVQQTDARVRLFRQESNRTAYQARKLGVEQARGSYVLFLDGDDRLSSDAVEVAYTLARQNNADLVGFGVEVVSEDGAHPGRFASDLQPTHSELVGDEILQGLFPTGKVAQGHLWRYLWSTDLLRAAYGALDGELELPRANDIPISFLGAVMANHYVSTRKKLYQYYWRRGVSGLASETADAFDFYLGAMDSIDAVGVALDASGLRRSDVDDLDAIYDSARLSMIQVLLRRCEGTVDRELRELCVRKLVDRVGKVDAVRAAALFFSQALLMLARDDMGPIEPRRRPPQVVMLTTGNLDIGGVQGVLAAQAKILRDAGYEVIVVVQSLGDTASLLPESVPVLQWTGRNRAEKMSHYLRICSEYNVDVIIDHHVLYNENWPFYALAARAQGIPTIGWLHNFALRSLYDSTTRGSFLVERLAILANVVVLSKADVAFWKSHGIERVTYLPNPPSPWLEANGVVRTPRRWDGGVLRLVWWGRLQQHTKRVLDFVDVAEELNRRSIDFHLTIIGPDSADATADQLRASMRARELDSRVTITGPLRGQDLTDALNDAHVYVSLSGIEGYPLTLIEAQALGMPVVMYELPWLAVLDGNKGVRSVPQKDTRALAEQLESIIADPSVYSQLSVASLDAATAATEHDFSRLYDAFLNGDLPDAVYSPAPTESDVRMLLDLSLRFSEEGIRRAARVERRAQARADELRKQISALRRTTSTPAVVSAGGVRHRILAASTRLRRRLSRSEQVVGAWIERDTICLQLRLPRGRALQSAQLYRQVDGTEIVHDLVLKSAPDGTILATQNVRMIMKRRWKVRATLLIGGTTTRLVALPIFPGAPVRGDENFGVRIHRGETVQVYAFE
ncbi:glycosyltransferase [Microbacterium resistens]|uniref:Glycosyltransferase n=1 Tax=Microbacterium resistens TaxID=156977 RepID=A0ABY3RR37_9MICO|nr:glycosyltransferase [Microbacterium resistens]UGS26391.1 glycosyltransferase [Microbacterium resistens]